MSQQSINGLNIPSLQNKRPVTFQQNPVPTMQGQGVQIDQEKLRQAANDNYISNRVKASQDDNPLAKLGIGTAIWYGIAQLMDKINPKMGGDFSTSLLGKIAGFGDRIANTALGRKTGALLDRLSHKTDNLAQKSQIVNTLKVHSTNPEWQFAKVPKYGIYGYWALDAQQVVEEFMKPIGLKVQKLEQYGLKQNEINSFLVSIKNETPEMQKVLTQIKELSLLGADTNIVNKINKTQGIAGLEKYAQALKARMMGLKGFRAYEKLNGKFLENPGQVVNLFKNIAEKHPDWKVSIWRDKTAVAGKKFFRLIKSGVSKLFGEGAGEKVTTALNKFNTHLFGRTVGFSEYANKGVVAMGKGGNSRLGRLLSKSFAWITEGATNRFGGGKLVVAMQAFIFADMVMATLKAPMGEKIKTAAERLVNDFSYFIAGTLGVIGMHKVGGFKYAGLKDKAAVDAYNVARNALNAKIDAGLFANKKAYKAAVKELNRDFLGVKNIKNPITKLLHKIGKFVNIGNERVHAYKSNAKFNLNWLRKIKNGNIIGVPLRIWIAMGLVTPWFVKLTTTACHKIFGRPTHSVLDEDEEENDKKQDDSGQIAQANEALKGQNSVNPAKNPTNTGLQHQYKNPQDYASDTNLIKMAANGQKPPQPIRTGAVNNSTVTTTTTTITNGIEDNTQRQKEPVRTYIPSPDSKVKNNVDLTPAEKALADADVAEKFVNETIAQLKM